MTTTFVDPFGLVLKGQGVNGDLYPTYQKLPKGVNTIMVSTRHTGALTVRAMHQSSWSTSAQTTLGTIPAGSGQRTQTFTVGIGADEDRWLLISASAVADATVRADVSVVNLPLRPA